ncbi:MAG: S1 RNA-binding domain-containing protein [Micropruina sp.]|uniref:S1 RNA-binding domain-containing protein n=1 Tax=Micropruina sp. TaxID=2737536 RepID=UPI0039E3F2F9
MSTTHNPPADRAWQAFVARRSEIVEGTVVTVLPFGAFVRVDEGVDGLLPATETVTAVAVGDRVRARVLQVDEETRRFSLRQA